MPETVDPENPYAPPRRDDEGPRGPEEAAGRDVEWVPAERMPRLFATMIDFGVIYVAQAIIGRFPARWLTGAMGDRAPELVGPAYRLVNTLVLVAVLAVQGALLARRGQSIGKVVLRLRVVRADGRPAGLWRAFLLRTLPFWVILWVTVWTARSSLAEVFVGLFFMGSLAQLFPVFFAPRRCGHDYLAGTVVVRASPAPLVDDGQAPVLRRRGRRRRASSRRRSHRSSRSSTNNGRAWLVPGRTKSPAAIRLTRSATISRSVCPTGSTESSFAKTSSSPRAPSRVGDESL